MRRGGGVLMHIASLPGPFGIGVFGEEAISFAKQLQKQGMRYWQVLPFTYPGMGDSPYQSFSAFAGNWLFIDPRRLMKRGLLTPEEVVSCEYNVNKWRIDYDFLRVQRVEILRKAFARADKKLMEEVDKFAKDNKWVDDVAIYQAIKDDNYQNAWWDWPDEKLRNCDKDAISKIRGTENYKYHAFVQYIFLDEWTAVKKEINECGIAIIGDMPIYVSGDSADVWGCREQFKMADPKKVSKLLADYDKEVKKAVKEGGEDAARNVRNVKQEALVFDKVAGVPPDYFSADG
ncbi:MAG: 4-alpha-glucanotransferase, partial [Clostridiales bacterium]|nr:4-alpha-glucanotransferase [Clostridiales bacterium]